MSVIGYTGGYEEDEFDSIRFFILHLFFCASAATVNYSRDGDAALYAQVPDSFLLIR